MKVFLKEWDENLFEEASTKVKAVKTGRWKQCDVIDRYTAGRIISLLLKEFLDSPTKRSLIEAACVLWILIWISQSGFQNEITLSQVLELTSEQVNPKSPTLEFFAVKSLEISKGLQKLLLCLRGKVKDNDSRPLFRNISLKKLERILHQVSEELGLNFHVQPGAFRIFPHAFPGITLKPVHQPNMHKF